MGEIIIVRNKDYYSITLENGKTMNISLAEGDKYVRGVSHKKLTKVPTYFGGKDIPTYLMKLALDCYCGGKNYREKVREYADRLISLPNYPYKVKNLIFKDIAYDAGWGHDIDWKFYINALKDIYSKPEAKKRFEEELLCQAGTFKSLYNRLMFKLQDYYQTPSHVKFLKNYGYDNFPDFIKCSKIKAFREGVKGILKREDERVKLCESLKKMISDFCGGMDYSEASSLIGVSISAQKRAVEAIGQLINKCLGCLDLKKRLNIDYQLTNIERDYQKLFIMANKNAWADDNVYFGEKQSQAYDKLHFENEKFETFIPTTREQLAEYGFAFNNCLNKWEWNNRLRYDYYYCVVVLSKETKKPLVCVDIDADRNGWRIDQYYGKNNSTIYNEELLAFKVAFQKHLSGE